MKDGACDYEAKHIMPVIQKSAILLVYFQSVDCLAPVVGKADVCLVENV